MLQSGLLTNPALAWRGFGATRAPGLGGRQEARVPAAARCVGRHRRSRAQVLVPFALCLPIVVLLVGLLIEVGVYVHVRNVVFAAAHEGAEAASAEGGSLDDGYARAEVVLRAGLGQYASLVTVSGQQSADTVVINVDGSLGVLQLQSDPHTAIGLPLHARARSTRELVP